MMKKTDDSQPDFNKDNDNIAKVDSITNLGKVSFEEVNEPSNTVVPESTDLEQRSNAYYFIFNYDVNFNLINTPSHTSYVDCRHINV